MVSTLRPEGFAEFHEPLVMPPTGNPTTPRLERATEFRELVVRSALLGRDLGGSDEPGHGPSPFGGEPFPTM